MTKPLRRTDKKDKSLFAQFSEQDIKTAELAFSIARINAEFQEKLIENAVRMIE